MKHVVGIGGVFLKARVPEALRAGYRRHFGVELAPSGGGMVCNGGPTVCSAFAADTDYLAPSTAPFMINYRVEKLASVLAGLKADGCNVDSKAEETADGRIGCVSDPGDNRLELRAPAPADLKP